MTVTALTVPSFRGPVDPLEAARLAMVEAADREARVALLVGWCRDNPALYDAVMGVTLEQRARNYILLAEHRSREQFTTAARNSRNFGAGALKSIEFWTLRSGLDVRQATRDQLSVEIDYDQSQKRAFAVRERFHRLVRDGMPVGYEGKAGDFYSDEQLLALYVEAEGRVG